MSSKSLVQRVRDREKIVGYWTVLGSPLSLERLGSAGYDYIAIDAQHGECTDAALISAIQAVNLGGSAALVRVGRNDVASIGRALDAGAVGVIVPLIDSAQDVAAAVRAAHYPPLGARSFGPLRGPNAAARQISGPAADALVLGMVETAEGLRNLMEICHVSGLDGIYIGPSDLSIGLGAPGPEHPSTADRFEDALREIREACAVEGIAAGIHVRDGEAARQRLLEGFTYASVASDLAHLTQSARAHLAAARGDINSAEAGRS